MTVRPAKTQIRSDWADAQADLSLRWAHSHFVGFVMRRLISTLRPDAGGVTRPLWYFLEIVIVFYKVCTLAAMIYATLLKHPSSSFTDTVHVNISR